MTSTQRIRQRLARWLWPPRAPVEPMTEAISASTVERKPGPPAGEGQEALADRRWLGLLEECVLLLYDELDRTLAGFDPARRGLAEHVCLRLQEILERSGVESIDGERNFDRQRHQPEPTGASIRPGATIAETISPGYLVGRRVLRRARVRMAEPMPAEEGARS